MQLILTDDVFNLGKRGQVVNVASGYGRNYLIPKGLAVPATAVNMKKIEEQQLALAKKEAKAKDVATLLGNELETLHLVISRKARETGALYGSVSSKDLADLLLEDDGVRLDRRQIALEHPIKKLGNLTVNVHLYKDVEAKLLVSVIPEEDPVAQVLKKETAESNQICAELEATVSELSARSEEESETVDKTTSAEPDRA